MDVRRQRANAQTLDFSLLESKQLLTGIVFNNSSMEVVVEGTSGNDTVFVTRPAPGQILVALIGIDARTFSQSSISGVRFLAFDGDDFFQNATSVNSFAYGHWGNDRLMGGSNVDRFQGGLGDDVLIGGNSNDLLNGNSGDDILDGQWGNDWIFGSTGIDQILGGDGHDLLSGDEDNDTIHGESGDDEIYGGPGNDSLSGSSGHDIIFGGDGDDSLFGMTGDDVLWGDDGADRLFGEAGKDRLYSGNGNDYASGGQGDDLVQGGLGNDELDGDDSDDLLIGSSGDDTLRGGFGNDRLLGQDGDDNLFGGDGDDGLWGEEGSDNLEGGNGNDVLFGGVGNDQLFGQSGFDELFGEAGLDGLFGGIGGGDFLTGGGSADRFLVWDGDNLLDYSSSTEGIVQFVNNTAMWNEAEIRVIDGAFRLLHENLGHARLMQDSLDNDAVKYVKYASLNGAPSANYIRGSGPAGNLIYDREIWVADWNENIAATNTRTVFSIMHEIGHSWDSILEIGNRRPAATGFWDQFTALSSWRSTNPGSTAYSISGDGKWWHLNSASFVWDYSKFNPAEDWSTVWEILYDPTKASERAVVQTKVNIINQLIAAI